jgi:hypothetical protein
MVDIKTKNLLKISEKIVHLLYHHDDFEYIYYKKDIVDNCLNRLFIKENYSHEKKYLHQVLIKKNDNYVNKLIKIERDKIIGSREKKRSIWDSFTIWLGSIITKIC